MCQSKKSYIVSILIALGVGTLSALLSGSGMKAYAELEQPPLSPPGFIFPIVWTILYILMGVGAALVYTTAGKGSLQRDDALMSYALQLGVNFFWSILFFRLEWRFLAFLWLVLLIMLVVGMIKRFYKISPTAAYLQIPYLIWICFAAYLNLGVWWLNRSW